ncbi:MAG: hypothetical protein XXXJIFNMEKO3_02126 [Candidatus Erwinia impunctatus]|nr:hypothetical protein XXXJIFNMEKO_02126 [Culicoides impunctatus]
MRDSVTIGRRSSGRTLQIYGYLLLLPAVIFLLAFTHYPAVATIWESFFQFTARGSPRAVCRNGKLPGFI